MFSKKFRLFRLFGFDVGIDPSWIILAILVAWSLSTGFFPFTYANLSTSTYWLMGVLGALGLFLSIVIHEYCHSLVAKHHGLPMKGITLFIFGGVAEMADEPPSARAELFIAIVGPLSSLALAAIFYGLNQAAGRLDLSVAFSGLTHYLAVINFFLALFNMIPAFPLDGGRVLRAGLWKWKGNLRQATRIAAAIGGGFGILLIVLGVLQFFGGAFIGGMWLFLIGLFIRSAANMSYKQLQIRRALEGEPLKRFMKPDPVIARPSLSIKELVEDYVYQYHYKLYPVVEQDQLKGCVSTRQIKSMDREKWADTTVSDVLEPCSEANTIDPDADAVEALSTMGENNTSRLLVSKGGRLLGIIALKDMLDFLSMKIELEQS